MSYVQLMHHLPSDRERGQTLYEMARPSTRKIYLVVTSTEFQIDKSR
jgi:hypothetical protein